MREDGYYWVAFKEEPDMWLIAYWVGCDEHYDTGTFLYSDVPHDESCFIIDEHRIVRPDQTTKILN
jgi:hypothetical protein